MGKMKLPDTLLDVVSQIEGETEDRMANRLTAWLGYFPSKFSKLVIFMYLVQKDQERRILLLEREISRRTADS